jgi:hypothetical protein
VAEEVDEELGREDGGEGDVEGVKGGACRVWGPREVFAGSAPNDVMC